jgi:NSS family neurotransmitter:Na+ symporter
LYILDASDHFINQYGIALAALVIVIVVAWVLRRLPSLRDHANVTSAVPLGRWWLVVLGIVTPVMLGWMMSDSLRTEFDANYGDYTTGFLLLTGWGVAIAAIVFGLVMSRFRWRASEVEPAVGIEEGSR